MSGQIAIFTNKTSWENQQIMLNLSKRNVDVRMINPEDIIFRTGRNTTILYENEDISRYNLFFNRLDVVEDLRVPSYGFLAFRMIESAGLNVVNTAYSVETAHNKFRTFVRLRRNRLPIPETMLVKGFLSAERAATMMELPLVVKPVTGSWGSDVYRADNLEEIHHIIENLSTRPWFAETGVIFQEYIKIKNRDIRVFVVGDEAVAGMYRYAPAGEWRTNIALGGRGVSLELTDELREMAVMAVRAVGGEVMSVDFVECEEDGQYKILEVNGAADFKGLTKATGINIAGRIADYLCERLNSPDRNRIHMKSGINIEK